MELRHIGRQVVKEICHDMSLHRVLRNHCLCLNTKMQYLMFSKNNNLHFREGGKENMSLPITVCHHFESVVFAPLLTLC